MRHASREDRTEHNKKKATEKRRFLKLCEGLQDSRITFQTLQKANSERKLTPDFLWTKLLRGKTFEDFNIKRRFKAYD